MNLSEIFKVFDRSFSEQEAIVWSSSDKVMSYGDFYREAKSLALKIEESFDKKKSPILIFQKPDSDFLISFFAVLISGNSPFIAALDLKEELKFLKKEVGGVLGDENGLETFRSFAGDCSDIVFINSNRRLPGSFEIEDIKVDDFDELMLCHSSGSTGVPKVIHGTFKKFQICLDALKRVDFFKEGDTFLTFAPFNHAYGMLLGTFLPFTLGGKVKVKEEALSFMDITDSELMTGVNFIIATPPTYDFLVEMGDELNHDHFSSLKYVISSAVKLEEKTINNLHDKFGIQLWEIYGTSEVLVVGTRNGTLKEPWAFFSGATWELGTKDNLKILSYLTPGKSEPEWFDTGDVVEVTQDKKNFKLLGRSQDFLKIKGVKVFCAEIETAISVNERVREVAVIPNGDNEQAIAFVVFKDSEMTEKALREDVRSRCQSKLIPHSIRIIEAIPRNNTGKVDKQTLKKLI